MRLLISGQGAFHTEARDEELSVFGRRAGHTLNRFRPAAFWKVARTALSRKPIWLLTLIVIITYPHPLGKRCKIHMGFGR